MKVSRLNKRVMFQKNVTITDAIGNHKSEWAPYYTCSATISGESGDEERDAGTVVDNVDLSVTVRYCRKSAAITTTGYRLQIDNDNYDIVSIDHFSHKHQALKFKCRKVRR